jgi:hypothetical protein
MERRSMNTIRFLANKICSETVDPIDIGNRPAGINLFELQMGLVDIGNGQAVWVSSLKKVFNGEQRYFKDWSELATGLQEILTPPAQFRVLQELWRRYRLGIAAKHTLKART